MEIAKSDQLKKQLLREVCARRKLLAKNLKKLKAKEKDNGFLSDVIQDYERYHAFILSEKERKKKAFQHIIQYLEKIKVDGKLTESDLRETKHEQDKLLGKLGDVRKELEELMKATAAA